MFEIFGIPSQALFGQLLLGLINGSFYALLSLGLAVIFGMLNIINFTHGAQYMMGAFAAYFLLPPSQLSTLLFAAAMGLLWLGVIPLVNGLVTEIFGVKFLATLTGVAFFSHQVGSFLGAWAGGVIYDALGSYDLAWQLAVMIGVVAGAVQIFMNDRPTARMAAAPASA